MLSAVARATQNLDLLRLARRGGSGEIQLLNPPRRSLAEERGALLFVAAVYGRCAGLSGGGGGGRRACFQGPLGVGADLRRSTRRR